MLGRGLYDSAVAEFSQSPPEVFVSCAQRSRKGLFEAFAYSQLGRDPDSRASLQQAEQPCPTPDPLLAADVATRRGTLEESSAKAREDYLTALDLARRQQDTYREAGARLNIGNATMRQEHYDESIDWNQASLQISRKMGYKRLEEKAEGNLAFAYEKLGDLDRALTLYEEAEQAARVVDAGDDRITWRNNLGLVHEETGKLATAEAEYRQALMLATQQGDKEWQTVVLGELALISIRTGGWDEAERYSEQARRASREDGNRPVELEALLAQGLIASHRGDLKAADRLLLRVARDPGHDRQSTRWEAQHLLADLYAREHRFADAEAEYRLSLATIRNARCSVQREELRMPFFANATRVYDSYIDFLVGEGKTAEALRAADENRALTLAEGLGVEGKSCLAKEDAFAPQVLARRENATILFYWLGSEHSYLWAVSPERIEQYSLPAMAEIEPAIEAYRRALVGARDVLQSEDKNGEQLYRTLVAPAAEFFHPGGRVIVITDGSLSGLSFETLIAPQPSPHYWIEDVTVENASSLRLLARRSSKGGRGMRKLLLMGDSLPSNDGEFGELPYAAEEMRSVGGYFPADKQVYARGSATAGAYLGSAPEQFTYIHFVAHGTASRVSPLDSAVVLSPSVKNKDDGYKLYGRDVIAHPLKAELVTISTCRGAGARSYTGEGLVGLSWAFLRAGAHHVIGALWDVNDSSTSQLMDRMYGELAKGESPAAALRTAKLSLLHGSPYHKPIYWAAFQLYSGS